MPLRGRTLGLVALDRIGKAVALRATAFDDLALLAAESIVALSRREWPEEQVINRDSRANFRWP